MVASQVWPTHRTAWWPSGAAPLARWLPCNMPPRIPPWLPWWWIPPTVIWPTWHQWHPSFRRSPTFVSCWEIPVLSNLWKWPSLVLSLASFYMLPKIGWFPVTAPETCAATMLARLKCCWCPSVPMTRIDLAGPWHVPACFWPGLSSWKTRPWRSWICTSLRWWALRRTWTNSWKDRLKIYWNPMNLSWGFTVCCWKLQMLVVTELGSIGAWRKVRKVVAEMEFSVFTMPFSFSFHALNTKFALPGLRNQRSAEAWFISWPSPVHLFEYL